MKSTSQAHRPPSRNGVGASCVALPTGPWQLLIDFLVERFKAIPRESWLSRMNRGLVMDESGQAVACDQAFTPHRRLYYFREVFEEIPIAREATILFEDEHLLVADKPHFLPVMPSGSYLHETLLVRLKRQLGLDTLVPVHRIDRDTAGLVLFSKQMATRNNYHALFRSQQVSKLYECLAPWSDALSWPSTRSSRIVEAGHFMLQHEAAGAPNAITHIDVLQTPLTGGPCIARYALRPITGKRHQLRVHMAAMGLPILGDGLYPTLTPKGQMDFSRPLQLLAKQLSFVDPITGKPQHFESRLDLHQPSIY